MTGQIGLVTADGVDLEAELAMPAECRAGIVFCHPHPSHGGTMRSLVVGAVFEAVPASGVACLRFNFRGVEGSGGTSTEGDLEPLDARAALSELSMRLPPDAPVVMGGWSFGADVALVVDDERVGGWLLVAPPLRFTTGVSRVGADPRPKRLVLGEHDQFRSPEHVRDEVAGWTATSAEIVPGADHFFIARTQRIVEAAVALVDELAATPRSGAG